MNDQIAIILPVYNGEKFINEQIDSLLNQTYTNIVIFIRDNCSEDSTVEKIEDIQRKYSEKIYLTKSCSNIGIQGSITELLNQVKDFNYVMFADGDDVWSLNKIELTYKAMKLAESEVGTETPLLVHSDLVVVDERLNVIAPSFWEYFGINSHRTNLNEIINMNIVTGCTLMMNGSLMRLATPIPEGVVMHDWWIAIIAAAFGQIKSIPEQLMLYRQHGKNDTGAKKYSFKRFISKKISFQASRVSKNNDLTKKIIFQASALQERYKYCLSFEQKIMISSFIKFKRSRFPVKVYLMIRHKFIKPGILRNVNEVFN